jgi:lipocalin
MPIVLLIIGSSCFYPKVDPRFDAQKYMGVWYQQAATKQPFLTGCTCVSAEYSLNVGFLYLDLSRFVFWVLIF